MKSTGLWYKWWWCTLVSYSPQCRSTQTPARRGNWRGEFCCLLLRAVPRWRGRGMVPQRHPPLHQQFQWHQERWQLLHADDEACQAWGCWHSDNEVRQGVRECPSEGDRWVTISHFPNVKKRCKWALIYHIHAEIVLVSFTSLGSNYKCARAFFQSKFLL